METVLLGSAHISEFQAVTAQLPEVTDVSWRNKGRHDTLHPEHACDVDSIPEIGLLAFGLLYVFWVGQDQPEAALFQNVEHRYLVFPSGFHADILHALALEPAIGKSNRWRFTFKRIYDSFRLIS